MDRTGTSVSRATLVHPSMTDHIVIIGAYGSAGIAAAERLVDEPDVELTLVDDGQPGGGLCLLRGCMPSKELLSAGAHRFQARHDDRLSGAPTVDLDDVVATKDRHVQGFAEHRRESLHELTERENVEFVHRTATFVDDHTIAVGERTLDADYVVVATGSTPNVPPIDGIDDVDNLTSDDVLDATEFPESGIVIGFGYIGMELVPYLGEVGGMELTVLERSERVLDEGDPALDDALTELYRDEFAIDLRTETQATSIEETEDGGVRLRTEHDGEEDVVEADQLFLFTGRRPALGGLELDRSALDPDPDAEWVEATMQARDDERVFVVGDANGCEPILHIAKEQGITAAENVLAHRDDEELAVYDPIHHHVIFSALGVYPFVRVGHSEASVQETDREYVAVTREARDDGVFKTKAVPEGLATLVVDSDDGTVLGYQGFHHDADVMAKTMQVVVETGMDVRDVPDRAYHPTTPELIDGLVREARSAIEE
ncbi:pyridine nucleotide-disulfide oxidoreductase dimerization region [Halococcus morrhuae DSM 1307]|uniref:Pyridine nucleotide-disulfide oxidoreductase dimerization region n=1 Tax=Halococcus morrhuae DSM 1307 TaxID=931277 RepID=M0N2D7_HALMO|nr:pyridine nucleotide-disulfide oxidoreductase dimerization region [Halococcus morrhuae DSM 1307]